MTNSGEASHRDPVPALRPVTVQQMLDCRTGGPGCLTLPVTSGGPGLAFKLAIYKNSSRIMKFCCSLLSSPARHPRPP